jgi:hypothetical protein
MMLLAVAVASDVDDVAVVHEPIDEPKGPHTVDQNRSNGRAYGAGALRLSRCRSKYTSAALNNIIHDE